MDIMTSDSLNTPTKRLQHLSIRSPDFSLSPIDIKNVMKEKGFSNSISNKVLGEINCRMGLLDSSPIKAPDLDQFHHQHQQQFSKMESILNHYSVKRLNYNPSSSSKKKRRTLTGALDTSSPAKQNSDSFICSNHVNNTMVPQTLNSSPLKRISPSKKSMNLTSLLNNKENEGFAVPKRLTSLEMAGVPRKISFPRKQSSPSHQPSHSQHSNFTHPSNFSHPNHFNGPIPQLRKPSASNIPRSPSSTSLSNQSISRKSSIPQLNKQPSRSHIPQLTKQPSTPNLNKKSSIPRLSHQASMQSLNRKSSAPQLQRKSSIPTLDRSSLNLSEAHKTTYDKPTVSSSQKSLNKFIKFKNKFS